MLRQQILSGAFVSGTRLPSINELTEQFGVARMTVKQAMDALVEENLIERYPGRGTFVKQIDLPARQTLHMKAELSQLHAMVEQLEVSVVVGEPNGETRNHNGIDYHSMQRIHSMNGEPFCCVDLLLDCAVYRRAPKRFAEEIVITVLKELDIAIESARQRVTISYADINTARALNVSLNSPVFQIYREFFGVEGALVYSANLTYPGDRLALDIEFAV